MPTAWFNALARLPEPMQPPLHPATREPVVSKSCRRRKRVIPPVRKTKIIRPMAMRMLMFDRTFTPLSRPRTIEVTATVVRTMTMRTCSVVSLAHAICSRPGTRMMLPAPYDLHCSPAAVSRAGSHASATLRAVSSGEIARR